MSPKKKKKKKENASVGRVWGLTAVMSIVLIVLMFVLFSVQYENQWLLPPQAWAIVSLFVVIFMVSLGQLIMGGER
jgi:hypothetical protein